MIGDGQKVTGIRYKDRVSGSEQVVELEGIFVQIGLLPNTDWLKGTVELSKHGEIIIDARGQTSVPACSPPATAPPCPTSRSSSRRHRRPQRLRPPDPRLIGI